MKLERIYLALCGLIYVVLGAWCTASHKSVASELGYALPSPTAEAEFIVVYGGLEIGVGLFLLFASKIASFIKPALYFVAILHVSLVCARVGTILLFSGFDPVIYNLLFVEGLLAVSAVFLSLRARIQLT